MSYGKINYIKSSESLRVLSAPHPLFKVDAILSPYAGCSCNCVFCPISSSKIIGVKTDFLHLLNSKLSEEKRVLHVGLGSACEPYCDEEKKFNLTRSTVELVMKYELPLQLFTKSTLVLKDVDLLKEHSDSGLLAVNISIFSLDDTLSGVFEPGLIDAFSRLEVLKELRKRGVFAGVALAPIIPYISDDARQLEFLFEKVKKAGGEYILPSVLNMSNKKVFDDIMKLTMEKFPKIWHRIEALYEKDTLPSLTYTQRINDVLKDLSKKHGIPICLPTEEEDSIETDIRHKLL